MILCVLILMFYYFFLILEVNLYAVAYIRNRLLRNA